MITVVSIGGAFIASILLSFILGIVLSEKVKNGLKALWKRITGK